MIFQPSPNNIYNSPSPRDGHTGLWNPQGSLLQSGHPPIAPFYTQSCKKRTQKRASPMPVWWLFKTLSSHFTQWPALESPLAWRSRPGQGSFMRPIVVWGLGSYYQVHQRIFSHNSTICWLQWVQRSRSRRFKTWWREDASRYSVVFIYYEIFILFIVLM